MRTIVVMFVLTLLLTLAGFSVAGGGVEQGTSGELEFTVPLIQSAGVPAFALNLRNRSDRNLEILYTECDFSYQIRIGQRTFRFPSEQLFAFASPCPGVQRYRRFAPHETVTLFVRTLRPDADRALRDNRLRFAGEFRFQYGIRYTPGLKIVSYRVR